MIVLRFYRYDSFCCEEGFVSLDEANRAEKEWQQRGIAGEFWAFRVG